MNDPLQFAQVFDPVSQPGRPHPAYAAESSRRPDQTDEAEADEREEDEREELVEELADDSEADDRQDAELFEERLGRIRDYEIDALQREDPLESAIASTNADLLNLHARYVQGLNGGLAAESYSLEALDANQKHLRQLLSLANQVQQFTLLELKLRHAPQRDPLRSHRRPSWPR